MKIAEKKKTLTIKVLGRLLEVVDETSLVFFQFKVDVSKKVAELLIELCYKIEDWVKCEYYLLENYTVVVIKWLHDLYEPQT